jgi:protein-S-isoprenylcysteine O-methyltransferase Ste14
MALFFLALAASRAVSEAPLMPGALALVVMGMAGRLLAGRHIAGHSNGLRLGEGPLAATGPYAWSRNPLYLSNLAVSAGLLLFANSLPPAGMAALFAGVCLHHALLVRHEERHLDARHGEAWRRYRAVTPRWLGPLRGAWKARADGAWKAGSEKGGHPSPAALTDPGSGPGPSGCDASRIDAERSLAAAWRKQGGNLATAAAAVLLIWGLGR